VSTGTPFNASTNQCSRLELSSREPKLLVELSGFAGNKKSLSLDDDDEEEEEDLLLLIAPGDCCNRSYSSNIFSRSSSVVTEIKASRSSLGNWYFKVIALPQSLESLEMRSE
jgi:hypothetical protein